MNQLICQIKRLSIQEKQVPRKIRLPIHSANVKKDEVEGIESMQSSKSPTKVAKQEVTEHVEERSRNIARLREYIEMSRVNHEDDILKQATLKQAHIYCVIHHISAQQYGPLLEKYIISKYGFTKQDASNCKGDCSKNGQNTEVKASLGGAQHNKFNYVQIRVGQDIQSYLFTAYHVCQENVEKEGELYIFRIPKDDMKQLIVLYGGYAHGTMKEHGEITLESLQDATNRKEYAIRPKIGDKCWKELLRFRIQEMEI